MCFVMWHTEEGGFRGEIPPRTALQTTHQMCILGPGGGGSPKALVHNLLMQFFTLGS